MIFEMLPGTRKSKILDILKWPLIGCTIGAGVVYWFGPMLVVFGMFAAGTAGIVLRETLECIRKNASSKNLWVSIGWGNAPRL